MDQKTRNLARNRALAILGKKYREEYQALYQAELEKVTEAGVESPPESSADDHVHAKARVGNGGFWVCECGKVSTDRGVTWR